MATFNLGITYPDNQQARILAALKAQASGTIGKAPADITNAEAIEFLRQHVVSVVKTIVRNHERNAAVSAVTDVGAA